MLYYDVFGIKAGGGGKPQRPISLQRQRPVFFRMLPSSVKIFGKYGSKYTEEGKDSVGVVKLYLRFCEV